MVSEQFQRRLCHLSLRAGIRSGILRRLLVYVVLPGTIWLLLSWFPKTHAAPATVAVPKPVSATEPAGSNTTLPHPKQDETPRPAITVSDLDAVMQQEILYKAMTQRAQQRAALAKFSDGDNASLITPSMPRVLWRRASAAGWVGKFSFDGGTAVVAGRGDTLPGGFTVSEINDRTVQVTREGKTYDLLSVEASTTAQAGENAQPTGPGVGMAMNPIMGMPSQTPPLRSR